MKGSVKCKWKKLLYLLQQNYAQLSQYTQLKFTFHYYALRCTPRGSNIRPVGHNRAAKGKILALILAFWLKSGPRDTYKTQGGQRTKIVARSCSTPCASKIGVNLCTVAKAVAGKNVDETDQKWRIKIILNRSFHFFVGLNLI